MRVAQCLLKLGQVIPFVVLFLVPTSAKADLQQLGDAFADVVTFGAWGQSRDQARAEIERLKLRFAEELQRAKNKSEALVATTRIEERTNHAIDAQQVGQELLKIVAAINVLIAQQKEIVVERYKTNKNINRFSEWFDSFVKVEDEKLDSVVALISATPDADSPTRLAALEAIKLAKIERASDLTEAREYLKDAAASASSETVAHALQTLTKVRNQLTNLIVGRQGKIRELVNSMAAEDAARRALCSPPYVLAVACNDQNVCRYYSADPGAPLPCNELVYLNVFPIEAIKAIYDNIESYAPNAAFFVKLGIITSTKPISMSSFRSPEEIFGSELFPENLLPEEFLIPKGCGDIPRYRKRLIEAFDYAAIFLAAEDRDGPTRIQIQRLQSWRPTAEFWLSGLQTSTAGTGGCTSLPPVVRGKLRTLMTAIIAAETFGDALTDGDTSVSSNPNTLQPIQKMIQDF